MKNIAFLFFLVIGLFVACNDKDNEEIPLCTDCTFMCIDTTKVGVIGNNCIDNWSCAFKILPQSMVVLDSTLGVAAGNKQVFQMNQYTQGDISFFDDESRYVLVFELDERESSFSVEGIELGSIQTHFKHICHCASNIEFRPVNIGCLQGVKQTDGTWLIQGNLVILTEFEDFEIKFDAQFSKVP